MASLGGKLNTAIGILRRSGLSGLRRRFAEMKITRRQESLYRDWLVVHGNVSEDQVAWIQSTIASFANAPLISVILPVYNVDEKWLRLCIESVRQQIYPNWELCIADDASPSAHVRGVLSEYAANDSRIKLEFRQENGHISAASNSALALATGDLVVLLDHDDELSPDALFWVANEINVYPRAAIIFSDEDLIDENGRRFGPKFKPDFSPDLLYSLNLMTHLSAYRTGLVRSIGGFRIGTEGSQDYDLELRAIEEVDEDQIRHIPRVLYHWRVIRGSVAFSMDEKPYAHERARDVIREHFQRQGIAGEVVESFHNLHRVHYSIPDRRPYVTQIVTETGDTRFDAKYLPFNLDHETMTIDPAPETRLRALATAAARARGDVLFFVDGDLSLTAGSTDELVAAAMQPGIGAAGARTLNRDMTVESAGIVLRENLLPTDAHRGFPREAAGNMYRNRQIGNFSAIRLSCMVIRREVFEGVGGFDAEHFPDGLFDVDLCLRLRDQHKRIVMLPHVELVRNGIAADREYSPAEVAAFQKRWQRYGEADPFCNPNLKRDGSFEIDV